MPNLVGIGNSQVPTNAMLGGLAYQDPSNVNLESLEPGQISKTKSINTTRRCWSKHTYINYFCFMIPEEIVMAVRGDIEHSIHLGIMNLQELFGEVIVENFLKLQF